jgi:hypothetical protein
MYVLQKLLIYVLEVAVLVLRNLVSRLQIWSALRNYAKQDLEAGDRPIYKNFVSFVTSP